MSEFFIRRSGTLCLVSCVLTLAALYFTVLLYGNLRTNIEELLPTTARSVRDLEELGNRVESVDSLAILVFSEDTVASKRFIEDLVAKLGTFPKDLVASVEYKIDTQMKFFEKRMALYMDLPDLVDLRKKLQDRIAFEKELHNPLNIFPVTDRLEKPEIPLDALLSKYESKTAAHRFPNGYFATPDSKKRAVLVYLSGERSNIQLALELTRRARRLLKEMNPLRYAPDLNVHLTGSVQMIVEEHEALVSDLELSFVVVAVIVTALLFLFFRSIPVTAALITSVFMGTFWTFGLCYFLTGYLNANSAFLGSIVLGNGINFGIIYVSRYLEERRLQKTHGLALTTALQATFQPTIVAALAAGVSYGSLCLTHFRGAQQFGLIGLTGMLVCWVSALVVLPALLTWLDRRFKPVYPPLEGLGHLFARGLAIFVKHWSPVLIALAIVGSTASMLTLRNLSPDLFETNFGNLRSRRSLEKGAAFYDRYLIEIFQRYLSPIVMLTDNREAAVRTAKLLRKQQVKEGPGSLIAQVSVFDDFLPEQQTEKLVELRQLKNLLSPEILESLDPLQALQVKNLLSEQMLRGVAESDLPEIIRRKFTDRQGELGRMVLIEPPVDASQLWKLEKLTAFVKTLREIGDSVRPGTPMTGTAPIAADMFYAIYQVGPQATAYSIIAVVTLVIVLFRNAPSVFSILSALFLGVIWFGGLILGFRMKINGLNFIALPITFGIGVDYAANIFCRYRQDGRIDDVIRFSGGPVILASLTTITGYCSLLMANNQALNSFGLLAVLGEITCVVAAVVVLPACISIVENLRATARFRRVSN